MRSHGQCSWGLGGIGIVRLVYASMGRCRSVKASSAASSAPEAKSNQDGAKAPGVQYISRKLRVLFSVWVLHF